MWGFMFALLEWMSLSPLTNLATSLGTTNSGIKLIVSIIMGYPVSIIYHKYVKHRVEYRHLYFILMGLDMAVFNFTSSFYHIVLPGIVMYFTTLLFGVGKMNTIFTIIFHMTYLLIGYAATESENYDITWTMPHCILTLKLIALSFDMWDGKKCWDGEELSTNNKKTAVLMPPSLIELLAFALFPTSVIVGPMFSFKRYSDFVADKFPVDKYSKENQSIALKRFIQGLVYLGAFQIGISVFDIKYMLTDEIWNWSIFYRHIYCGLWAHFALYKYIASWLISEAACIRIGIAYNGEEKTTDGVVVSKWDACHNVRLRTFELATRFQHYIDGFNCNTNHFAAEYIYKRLKFLGNRNLSQFFTLLFLAIWHGLRSGYYMTFFNEFIIIYMEKEFQAIVSKTDLYRRIWSNTVSKYIMYALLKFYTIIFMGWSFAPFDLKLISKWWTVYQSLYFSGFLIFGLWPFLYKPIFKSLVKTFKNVD